MDSLKLNMVRQTPTAPSTAALNKQINELRIQLRHEKEIAETEKADLKDRLRKAEEEKLQTEKSLNSLQTENNQLNVSVQEFLS